MSLELFTAAPPPMAANKETPHMAHGGPGEFGEQSNETLCHHEKGKRKAMQNPRIAYNSLWVNKNSVKILSGHPDGFFG